MDQEMTVNKILLNSELPKCMLDKNDEVNDFDFVLFSAMQECKEYREFFGKRMQEGKRMTILDNSAYEFFLSGGKFNEAAFIETIKEYRPTYCLVPDVLMDKKATLNSFHRWKGGFEGTSDTKFMVVPQGKSLKEWLSCYTEMLEHGGFDAIAIPFHNDFFWDIGQAIEFCEEKGDTLFNWNDDIKYCNGRLWLLQFLDKHDLIDSRLHYHLLGTHQCAELEMVGKARKEQRFAWIDSADSSYPVTKGIMNKGLTEGLAKEKVSFHSFYNMELTDGQKDQILLNLKTYRSYV